MENRNIKVFFWVLTALAIVFYPGPARSGVEGFISLEVQDETLEKTLGKVSDISGYTIDLEPKWHDLKVSIRLVNIPLEEAILKILDNRINYAVIWKHKDKKILILGTEIFPERKINSGITPQQKKLSGQGVMFEQGSRTTN